MLQKFEELARIFNLEGSVVSYSLLGNGHINTTYKVKIETAGKECRYVFQKVNMHVFRNPQQMMRNIEMITSHMAQKLGDDAYEQNKVMQFSHTVEGNNYYIAEQSFWRVYKFIPNTVTYDFCSDLEKQKSAGEAFGKFQTMLSDFDVHKLCETIPDFHNTRNRLTIFYQHVDNDPCGRAAEVKEEIQKIQALEHMAVRLNELLDRGELPVRVTHNDTKMNNVLFDIETGEAKTVIDLDTVMPGLVAHDFGDAIRFGANTAVEDEADLSKVSLDINRFRAFAEGFISEVAHSLTAIEVDTLALGAFTITLEQAVRFLDDYIMGDTYFRTKYREHNLVRARCQLKLAEEMYARLDEMNMAIAEIMDAQI